MTNSLIGDAERASPKTKDDQNEFCCITKESHPGTYYRIYLNMEVVDNHFYTELFETLHKATQLDYIEIIINNFGGYLYTATQIVNAIRNCDADIVTIVSGAACSAGSLIFMAGPEKRIEPNSYVMCHYYSGGVYGKGNEIEVSAEFNKKRIQQLNRDLYKDLLTEDELDRMFKGEDFYFDTDEVIKRLKLGGDEDES